jgi:hypothetical protein
MNLIRDNNKLYYVINSEKIMKQGRIAGYNSFNVSSLLVGLEYILKY